MITKESLRLGNHFYQSQVVELLEDVAVLRNTIGGHHHRVRYTDLQAVVVDGNIPHHTYGFTVRQAGGGLYCISGLCLLPIDGGWQVSSSQYPDTRTFHFLHDLENTYFARRHRTLPLKPGSDPVEEVTFEGMAAELQIGNIVNGRRVKDGEITPIRFHELTKRGITHSGFKAVLTANGIEIRQGLDQNDPMPYSWVSGIPLSPEWIQDLGNGRYCFVGFKAVGWYGQQGVRVIFGGKRGPGGGREAHFASDGDALISGTKTIRADLIFSCVVSPFSKL